MQNEREIAVPGKPVNLWLHIRDAANKKLLQPTSVGNVKIYNSNNTLITTLIPTLANPGTYLAIWNVPAQADVGQYKDVWPNIVTPEHNFPTEVVQYFVVSKPVYEQVTPIVENYKVLLVNREIVRNSKVYLHFILQSPKNSVFPLTYARLRNDTQRVDNWFEVETSNNEGFMCFDATNITLGQYYVQLKLVLGDVEIYTPEFNFIVRDF